MKMIPFFDDSITIAVHSSTSKSFVNKNVSIKDFADSAPVSLYELENGELLCRKANCEFIEGAEVGTRKG